MRSYSVFNKLELLTDFQPLVYFCNKGVGMFSKSVTMMLLKADLKPNNTIILSLNNSSSLSQTNNTTSDIVIKLDWYNKRFNFKCPNLAQNLSNITPKLDKNNIGYYCGFVNVDYSKAHYSHEILTKWEVISIESLTNEITFYKTHALAQKERHEKNRDELLSLLKVGMSFYNEWLFSSAFVFLEDVLNLDQLSIKILTESNQFWHWWKLQYYIMDETILYDYCAFKDVHLQDIADIRSYYKEKHTSPPIQLERYLYHYLSEEKAKIRTSNKMKTELC
ncbi:MAG: hypothetical protein HQ521_05975 [Bacteroidetes bacterium]|nr:hypothetical protein [Bacteroidota bacterium]